MSHKHFMKNEHIPADEAARAPVTRSAVLDDLRQMILATADFVALVGPVDVSPDQVLGFEVGEWSIGLANELPHERIDLNRFRITGIVNRAYDFAWQVGDRESRCDLGHDAICVHSFIQLAPQQFTDTSGTPMESADSALRQTLRAARARYYLDNEIPFSIADMALLARMTEPAARASLSKEGIRTSGGKNDSGLATIEHRDAIRWLEKRRGFVPTEKRDTSNVAAEVRDIADLFREAAWKDVVIETTGIRGIDALAELTKTNADWLRAVLMEQPAELDIAALERIGSIIANDTPRFVGIAIERMMRANADPKGQPILPAHP
ncbi:MAG: hypothetical protein JJT99_15640 [Rhodobacteraceae bacterium]|nr:hypothetical protein [Paracoccaceae bacterium]